MRPIRVLILDDYEIVRLGLRSILSREKDIHVVGAAGSGVEGLALIEEVKPDVVVVDYSLGPMSGVEVCERVTAEHPEIHVIMFSTFLDDEVIQRSIQAGAKAYVYKDVEGRDLKNMIRSVVDGQAVPPSKGTGPMIRPASGPRSRRGEDLSDRERDVLRLVGRGASNAEIAAAMGITLNMVKTYLRRAMDKLECHTRGQAAVVAARQGRL